MSRRDGERTLLPHQEGIDSIDTVDGRIPGLRTLLLQEPALHLTDGLQVVGRDALQGLDGNGLCRNGVVEPRVSGTLGVVVAAYILTIDGIFLERLDIFEGTLRLELREDDSRKGFLIHRLVADIFLQELQQVVVGTIHV